MITANDRYSGNNRYSEIKGPDHFFHYRGRCLYILGILLKGREIVNHSTPWNKALLTLPLFTAEGALDAHHAQNSPW